MLAFNKGFKAILRMSRVGTKDATAPRFKKSGTPKKERRIPPVHRSGYAENRETTHSELAPQHQRLHGSREEFPFSQGQLSDLYCLAPVGYFILDGKGRILGANETGTELLGTARPSLIKKFFSGFIFNKEEKDVFRRHLNEVVTKRSLQVCEIRLKKKNSHAFFARLQSNVSEDTGGCGFYVRMTVSDIAEQKSAEHAQRIAREQAERGVAAVNTVFDSLAQPVIVFDDCGKPVRANTAALHAFGLDMTQLGAKGYLKLLRRFAARREDGTGVQGDELPVRRALQGETVSEETYAFTNARGEALTFDVSATPLFAAGKITGAVAVWYDVTARRQMEEALRERELMFRRLIDSNIIGIIVGSGEVIEEANDIVLYMLGYSHNTLHRGEINLGEITPSEYEYLDRRAMAELMDYGASIPYEKEFLRRDGRRVAVLIGSALLERSTSKWISFVLDLTERRRMERLVQESEERLQMAISVANEAIWDWNVRENTIKWNETYGALFGRPGEAAAASRWWVEHLHPEDRPRVLASLSSALQAGESSWGVEYRILRSDGRWAYVYDRAYIARDQEGNPRRVVGAMLDLTERKHAEEALESRTAELEKINRELEASYRDLESFSYSVSHDLRSPLVAISGFCRILMERYGDKLDATGKDLLRRIRDNGIRMEQLIRDILSFSRIGKREIMSAEIDMEKLAKSAFEELTSAAAVSRNVLFEWKPLPAAFGDPSMIRQVFSNLLSNAIKFTEPRDVAVIEVGGRTEGDELLFYVKDNGVGFSMENYNRLFGLFQRLHLSEQFAGTGVGLAIIKRIIEKHGGRVWAEGKLDKGAAFYFTLPKKTA
jgi:PAS domain S-box-containing protein